MKEEFISTLLTQKSKAAEQLCLLESTKGKGLKPIEESALSLVRMLTNIDDVIQGLTYCKN